MGTRNTKTSCFVSRVSCISIQTREPQVKTRNKQRKKVETRNKHEKLKNLHIILDLFKSYYSPLRSSNLISCYKLIFDYILYSPKPNLYYLKQFLFDYIKFFSSETLNTKKHEKSQNFKTRYKHENMSNHDYKYMMLS